MDSPPEKETGALLHAPKTEAAGEYTSVGVAQAYEAFRAAMCGAGITHGGEIIADGKLHRFKAEGDHERNSWYVLHAGPPAAGAFGCWKRCIKENWSERRTNFTQAESQRIRQQIQDAEAKGKRETAARQVKAQK